MSCFPIYLFKNHRLINNSANENTIPQADVHEEFYCSICQGVMCDPVQAPKCLHDFGIRCLITDKDNEYIQRILSPHCDSSEREDRNGALYSNTNEKSDVLGIAAEDGEKVYKCPETGCSNEFLANELKPANKLASLIGKLCLICDNKCGWNGLLSELQHHKDQCPLEVLKCPFNCGETTIRKEYIDHKSKCIKRPEQCEYCNKEFMFQDLSLHVVKCDLRPILCPQCCCVITKDSTLDIHKSTECPETVIPCPFAEFGCDVASVPRKRIHDHLSGSVHQHCTYLIDQLIIERKETSVKTQILEDRITKLEGERELLYTNSATCLNEQMDMNQICPSSTSGGDSASPLYNKHSYLDVISALEREVMSQQEIIDRIMRGATLTVDGNGAPGTFLTIQQAYEVAREGDTIIVRAGTYQCHDRCGHNIGVCTDHDSSTNLSTIHGRDSLVLDKPNVWIRGSDKNEVILEGNIIIKWHSSPNTDTPREISGHRNLRCYPTHDDTSRGEVPKLYGNVLPVDNPWDLLQSDIPCVKLINHTLHNLVLSNVTIKNQDSTKPSIRVKCLRKSCAPRIQNCIIESTNLSCVVVDEGQPSFEHCIIKGSKQFGVLWRSAPAKLTPSSSHTEKGMKGREYQSMVDEESQTILDGATGTDQIEFSLSQSRSFPFGKLFHCTIENCKETNIVVEKGELYLCNCKILKSDANGALVKPGAVLNAIGSHFYNNAYSNIDVMSGGIANCLKCNFYGSLKSGAFIIGKLVMKQCKVFDNEMPNIVVMSDGEADLETCGIYSGLQYGIVVKKRGNVKLTGDCSIKGNCLGSIIAEKEGVVEGLCGNVRIVS
eukprot:Tbor_TRINITY_DN6166_c3_g1::TRINITY_DN6166_c3_g1_i1::g.21499::m.21499